MRYYAVKKDGYNAKIKNIEEDIPDITKLAKNTTLNARINEVRNEIPNITIWTNYNTIVSEI